MGPGPVAHTKIKTHRKFQRQRLLGIESVLILTLLNIILVI